MRAALYVNEATAQATVKSDPIPQILQGIPLDVRSVTVRVDREQFALNPTNCEAKSITAEAVSTTGNVAHLANRFQVGGCAGLAFKPNLKINLKGGTKRNKNPALTATVTYPKGGGYANIASAQVTLPHSEFLDQAHIRTVCTRVQFAANACPAGSVYGHAVAKTPLFATPLEGPVILRSSSNPLPDLVAVLKGPAAQPIEVDLVGRIDSIHGGIRNTFEVVPDAPVETFTLELLGGDKGLLVNSTNLCRSTNKATANFTAQNGKTYDYRPVVTNSCKGKAKKKKGKGHKKH